MRRKESDARRIWRLAREMRAEKALQEKAKVNDLRIDQGAKLLITPSTVVGMKRP